jgi:diadenosine tetraphosphate (Ap4A) HIT family hydrolase
MSLCPRCGKKIDTECNDCKIVLNDYCSLCDYKTLRRRIFYEDKNNIWICFLAAPYHTEGHSIIVPIDKKATKYNSGDEGHFHFHIIPRWSNDEKWESKKGTRAIYAFGSKRAKRINEGR